MLLSEVGNRTKCPSATRKSPRLLVPTKRTPSRLSQSTRPSWVFFFQGRVVVVTISCPVVLFRSLSPQTVQNPPALLGNGGRVAPESSGRVTKLAPSRDARDRLVVYQVFPATWKTCPPS